MDCIEPVLSRQKRFDEIDGFRMSTRVGLNTRFKFAFAILLTSCCGRVRGVRESGFFTAAKRCWAKSGCGAGTRLRTCRVMAAASTRPKKQRIEMIRRIDIGASKKDNKARRLPASYSIRGAIWLDICMQAQ